MKSKETSKEQTAAIKIGLVVLLVVTLPITIPLLVALVSLIIGWFLVLIAAILVPVFAIIGGIDIIWHGYFWQGFMMISGGLVVLGIYGLIRVLIFEVFKWSINFTKRTIRRIRLNNLIRRARNEIS